MAYNFTDDLSVFFDTDEFAEAGTYTPASTGTPIPDVPVILDRYVSALDMASVGVRADRKTALMPKVRGDGTALPAPAHGDTLAISPGTFTVRSYREDEGGHVYILDLGT